MRTWLKYLLLTFLIILTVVVGIEMTLLLRARKQSPTAPKTQEFVGVISKLGSDGEFTIEKDGQVVFARQATDLSQIEYRLSSPGKLRGGQWSDLKIGDRVALMLTFDATGRVKSRLLRIFRD